MRILLTGASGFLGARLAARLDGEGHELFVLPSPRFGGARLAGLRYALIGSAAEAAPELVYHLAGPPMEAPAAELERGIVGAARRLAAELSPLGTSLRRVILASSGAVYGSGERRREDDPLRPDTALGRAKLEAAGIFREAGLPLVELRLFTPYGEGEAPSRLIPSALAAARTGEPVRLRTSGEQTRDYVYAGDVIDAFAAAGRARLDAGIALNICSGKPRRAVDVARLAAELAGSCAGVEPGSEEPAALRHNSGHPGRASALLGWQAHTSLHEGLRRLATTGAPGPLSQKEQQKIA